MAGKVMFGEPHRVKAELFGPQDGAQEELSGAWLRVTLRRPDGTETRLSSEVFDRVGVAARDAGATATAPLRDLGIVADEYAALATIWQLAVMTGPIVEPAAPCRRRDPPSRALRLGAMRANAWPCQSHR